MMYDRTPFARRASTAIVLVCALAASPALSRTRAGVDVSLSGRAASNPFNQARAGEVVFSISPDIEPWLTYENVNTEVEARGGLLIDQYSRFYDRATSGSANLTLRRRVSETVLLRTGASYLDSTLGVHENLLLRNDPANVEIPAGTPLPDLGTAGTQTRVQTVSGRVGADFTLSALDSMSVDFTGNVTASDLPRTGSTSNSSDFRNLTGNFSYRRKINERASGTVSVQYSDVNYFRTLQGDGSIISPQAGFSYKLGRRYNVDISLGATFARFKTASGATQNFTVLAGSARLCGTIQGGNICLNAGRTAQPTVLGGISSSTDVALSLDKRLDLKNLINLTARYSRTSQNDVINSFSRDFVGAIGTYSRKFNDRLSGFVSPGFSKTYGGAVSQDANYEIRAGVTYRFGSLR